jgi:CMP-N-acetylneuraminic acid synthetase
MKPLAIIPARGGSVRIPRKNVMQLNGKAALAYPVSACISSGIFETTIVSTDDKEIASVAKLNGAEVDIRGQGLSDGAATIHNVVEDLLNRYLLSGSVPEYFCIVYATAVLVEAKHLKESFELLKASETDAVLAVKEFDLHPYKALELKNKVLSPAFPDKFVLKSQEYPKYVAPAGAFHWMRTASFLHNLGSIWAINRLPYVLSSHEAVDLDEPSDIELVKRLLFAKEHMS